VEGVAILLGVDRFMSEARAITNLIGNGAATLVIARSENAFFPPTTTTEPESESKGSESKGSESKGSGPHAPRGQTPSVSDPRI